MRLLMTLLLSTAFAACAGAPPREAQTDVPYGSAAAQRLDLYTPRGDAPFPLVVDIHGGGWHAGDKDECDHGWTDYGYAVACLNYRLAPAARFPAQIDDVRAAVRWLRQHSAIDARRVVVIGTSAGGHLALLLALSETSSVRAVVSLAGPTDFLSAPVVHDSTQLYAAYTTALERALGGPVAQHRELARTMSPTQHADTNAPPVLLIHGTADDCVPLAQSTELRDVLRNVGAAVKLQQLSQVRHEIPLWSVEADIAAFFAEIAL